jgi:hypothetical protein
MPSLRTSALLLALFCFFVADSTPDLIRSLLGPAPARVDAPPPPLGPLVGLPVDPPVGTPLEGGSALAPAGREVVREQDSIFDPSLLAPPSRAEEPERLEATRLPLSLQGTVISADPALSWATLQDLEQGTTVTVGVGDPVGPGTTLLHVGRRHIVLLEDGVRRELAMDEEGGAQPATPTAAATQAAVEAQGYEGPFEFCRAGNRGGGWDPGSQTYEWTCGNYPWSAEVGGKNAAGSGDFWNQPTTPGGNSEYVTCTGSGLADDPNSPGTDIIVESCIHPGERVKTNAMADLMLATIASRPGGGNCSVFVPRFTDSTHGIYEFNGCGRDTAGNPNSCPVLPPPYDTHPQRKLQIFGGRMVCLEGTDTDGPFEPISSPPEQRRTGVWFSANTGWGLGAERGSADPDGSGTTMWEFGSFTIGPGNPQGSESSCVPLSATDPRCDPSHPNASGYTLVGSNLYGRTAKVRLDSIASEDVCVTNTLSATGTCRGDRRIRCTANGIRTNPTSGGCDFGPGGDLGPCEGFVDAFLYDYNDLGRKDSLRLGLSYDIGDFASNIFVGGAHTAVMSIRDSAPSSYAACDGGLGRTLSFGAPRSDGKVWAARSVEIESDNASVSALDAGRRNNQGGGLAGGSFIQATFRGKIGGDNQAADECGGSCIASGPGSGSNTLVHGEAGFATDEFAGMTLILRPNAPPEGEGCDCDATSCRRVREITSNDATTIAVGNTWHAFEIHAGCAAPQGPAAGDEFVISSASCGPLNNIGNAALACDIGFQGGVKGSEGGSWSNFQMWYGGVLDFSGSVVDFRIEDGTISRSSFDAHWDTGDAIWRNVRWRQNFADGTMLNIGFAGSPRLHNVRFEGNRALILVNIGFGSRMHRLEEVDFVGNNAMHCLMISNANQGVYEKMTFVGNTCGITLAPSPGHTIAHTTLRDINFIGRLGHSFRPEIGRVYIAFSSAGGTRTGSFRNVLLERISAWVEGSAGQQPCLFGFDSHVPGVSDTFGSIVVRDSDISTVVSAARPRAVCVFDQAGTSYGDADDDVGWGLLRNPPQVSNVSSDGQQDASRPPQ